MGYLVKGTSATEIVEAVRRAARGQASLSIEAISSMIEELVGDRAERERAEGVLRRSEERFRGLVESAPDAVVVIDEGGAMQLVNAETERLFGYTRDELLGQPIECLLPEHFSGAQRGYRAGYLVHPTTPSKFPVDVSRARSTRRDRVPHVDISVTALETDDRPASFTKAGTSSSSTSRRSGAARTAASSRSTSRLQRSTPTRVASRPRSFAMSSERRRVEVAARQLAAIIESSDDAIIGKDVEGTIETWNLGAERMYGYSAEEAVGRSIALLTPPDLPDDLPEILAGLRRGEEVEQYETKRMRKDEVVLDVLLKVSAIRDVDGQIVGTSSMARDVTKLKAQAELERERALLAHLVGAGEEERGRIARGDPRRLHPGDHRGGHAAADPSPSLDDPEHLQLLDELEETIQLSIARLRHLLFELHPPALDTDGLSAALEMYLEETQRDGPTKHRLEDNLTRPAVAPDANDPLPHRPGAPGERADARAGRERDRPARRARLRLQGQGDSDDGVGFVTRGAPAGAGSSRPHGDAGARLPRRRLASDRFRSRQGNDGRGLDPQASGAGIRPSASPDAGLPPGLEAA